MRVLVTTDGSERSRAVLPHAARMAWALDGELVYARVLDPRVDCRAEAAKAMHHRIAAVAERWNTELDAELAANRIEGRSLVAVRGRGEHVHESILRVASEERASIVAMASRGSGLLRHAVLGSVALGVVGAAEMPVLVAGEHVSPPSNTDECRVLVTTDGSPASDRAIDAAIALARHSGIGVTVLRVHVPRVGDRGDATELAEAAAELDGIQKRFPEPAAVTTVVLPIVKLGGVDSAIANEAAEIGAAAVVMSTHGSSARHHVLAGSVALGVLGQASVPVMLVRSRPAPR